MPKTVKLYKSRILFLKPGHTLQVTTPVNKQG